MSTQVRILCIKLCQETGSKIVAGGKKNSITFVFICALKTSLVFIIITINSHTDTGYLASHFLLSEIKRTTLAVSLRSCKFKKLLVLQLVQVSILLNAASQMTSWHFSNDSITRSYLKGSEELVFLFPS